MSDAASRAENAICQKIARILILSDFLTCQLSRYAKLHLKAHRSNSVRNFAMSDAASVENPVAARYKNPRVSGRRQTTTSECRVKMPETPCQSWEIGDFAIPIVSTFSADFSSILSKGRKFFWFCTNLICQICIETQHFLCISFLVQVDAPKAQVSRVRSPSLIHPSLRQPRPMSQLSTPGSTKQMRTIPSQSMPVMPAFVPWAI